MTDTVPSMNDAVPVSPIMASTPTIENRREITQPIPTYSATAAATLCRRAHHAPSVSERNASPTV